MLSGRLQSLLRQGQTLQCNGQLTAAADLYAQLRAAAPDAYEGWHFGGMAALLQAQVESAEQLLARAVALNPSSTQTALGLGVARVAKGDSAGAETVLRALTMKQPKLTEAWNYLALALETQRRHDDAIVARRKLVALEPRSASAWANLGTAISASGKHTEALECFSRALRIDEGDVRARLSRAMTLFKCHRVTEAAGEFAAVVTRGPVQFEARSCRVMSLNYLSDVSREQIFDEHQAYGRAAGPPVNVDWPNTADPKRRLRIAFLSPDLNRHPVPFFLEPLLQHLDRTAFEIVLYHDNAQVDEVSARLRTYATLWRNFANQINPTIEPVLKADAPDILVDLTGHAGTNRLQLLARRVAPVQITYLGYPNTTGVGAMDYRLVDEITDPTPEADFLATEKLVRFAPTAWSYLPPADAPEVTPVPGVGSGFITFGAFNNFSKVTDDLLRVWARILAAIPGARLLIKSTAMEEPEVRADSLARLRAAGVCGEQVEILPRTSDTASHLALYGRVDIALDTFPYHGTTTTCEALWMGVPVVTRAGDRHASRVGVSLLKAIGHPEWIATGEDDYVRIAIEWASDQERLTRARQTLRDDMKRSPLLDHAGQARRLGVALRSCWAEWCGRQLGRGQV